jgi:hypothetical protein
MGWLVIVSALVLRDSREVCYCCPHLRVIHTRAQVVGVLGLLLDKNQRWTQEAKVGEVLLVEKRKERLQQDPKPVVPSHDGNQVL